MYATATNPWQSSAAISPWQTGDLFLSNISALNLSGYPAFAYGYSQPYRSAMFSPVGNIQTGFIPQGSITYGYYPGWGWDKLPTRCWRAVCSNGASNAGADAGMV